MPSALAGDAPRVAASILPIHSLVSGVMQGVGTPTLIVRGYGSPHTHRMRPSNAASLHRAELVFWVGDTLETFLERPLSSLSDTVRVIPLLETEGLVLHKNREGGLWETHASHGHIHAHAASHAGYNPHIWLDPGNARQLVKAIARHLRQFDPDHKAQYQANAKALSRRIRELEKRLDARFSGFQDMPYLVFHDAYLYLERRYGLRAVGSITSHPDRMPGAKRITRLRSFIQRLSIRCIFREPQFNAKLIGTAFQDMNIRIGELDPLGVHISPGPEHWFHTMDNLADVIIGCLSQDRTKSFILP